VLQFFKFENVTATLGFPGCRTMRQSVGEAVYDDGLQATILCRHRLSQTRPKIEFGTFQDPWARMRNVESNYP
jgi:hypothetical protein